MLNAMVTAHAVITVDPLVRLTRLPLAVTALQLYLLCTGSLLCALTHALAAV